MTEIRSHNLFKTTMLKSEVKVSLFHFEKAKAALTCIVTNEEHSSEVWLAYIYILDYLDPSRLVPTSLDNQDLTVPLNSQVSLMTCWGRGNLAWTSIPSRGKW